jgi:hypothetical protein
MTLDRRFSVIEYSSFFAVRDNASGDESPMGDGVDTLWRDDDTAMSPGDSDFVETWESLLNSDSDMTLGAYFPDSPRNEG